MAASSPINYCFTPLTNPTIHRATSIVALLTRKVNLLIDFSQLRAHANDTASRLHHHLNASWARVAQLERCFYRGGANVHLAPAREKVEECWARLWALERVFSEDQRVYERRLEWIETRLVRLGHVESIAEALERRLNGNEGSEEDGEEIGNLGHVEGIAEALERKVNEDEREKDEEEMSDLALTICPTPEGEKIMEGEWLYRSWVIVEGEL